jgi:glycosylphosphatidylinositol transamidase (GPIT) subunit GPI8
MMIQSFLIHEQDSEEITNIELADAFQQMWAKRRYNEIFFMIDTCQVGKWISVVDL